MLYLRYDKPKNQSKAPYSIFISFRYDIDLLQKVKQLPLRYWIAETKEWEVPSTMLYLIKQISEVTFLNSINEDEKCEINDSLFKTQPLTHQREGVEYGLSNLSWLLGDEQGLGKTKQIIDLAIQKKNSMGMKHCLIICGINNLKYNWVNEIKKHSDETCCILGKRYVKEHVEPSSENKFKDLVMKPDEFFWITNIESLRCKKEGRFWKSDFVELINDYISEGEIGFVVVDEIHKAKNSNSGQGRGLLKLKGCHKIGMSGTLLVNKPIDLFMPLRFIDAIGMNQYTFNKYFTVENSWGAITGYKNMKELQTLMDVNMLRRTKKLLTLPPKIQTTELLEMSKDERRLYNEICEATKNECDKIANPVQKLAQLIRLRQVCCHTSLVSTKVTKSTKFDRLNDLLEEARDNGSKVIVFSMFRQLIELALEEFKSFNPLHIWGGMNAVEFNDNINRFQNENGFKVLFGVIQAAGTGITLNEADTVIFLDLPWNRATMEQAEDRAHRIGSKKTVNVISLLLKDSYDEALHNIIINKKIMGDILIDGADTKVVGRLLKILFKEGGIDE